MISSNEPQNNIHTKISTNLVTAPSSRKCFPSMATVKLEDGKGVLMSELQVGDHVQTGINLFFFDSKTLKSYTSNYETHFLFYVYIFIKNIVLIMPNIILYLPFGYY